MKLEIFNDSTAMFVGKREVDGDFTIRVNGEGYLHIGEKVYPIRDGIASIQKLPEGDYSVSVVSNDKVYQAYEHIVNENGHVSVDSSHLYEMILSMKSDLQKLQGAVEKLVSKYEIHERKISGATLF